MEKGTVAVIAYGSRTRKATNIRTCLCSTDVQYGASSIYTCWLAGSAYDTSNAPSWPWAKQEELLRRRAHAVAATCSRADSLERVCYHPFFRPITLLAREPSRISQKCLSHAQSPAHSLSKSKLGNPLGRSNHAYAPHLSKETYLPPTFTYHQPSQPRERPARDAMWNSRWRIAKPRPLAPFLRFVSRARFAAYLSVHITPRSFPVLVLHIPRLHRDPQDSTPLGLCQTGGWRSACDIARNPHTHLILGGAGLEYQNKIGIARLQRKKKSTTAFATVYHVA